MKERLIVADSQVFQVGGFTTGTRFLDSRLLAEQEFFGVRLNIIILTMLSIGIYAMKIVALHGSQKKSKLALLFVASGIDNFILPRRISSQSI
jgi:hypothetical protein